MAAIGADAKKFKIDPLCLLHSPRWQHRAEPPDFELMLIQAEPLGWVHTVNLVLLRPLRDRSPEAIDWERLTAAGIVSQLDAFEG